MRVRRHAPRQSSALNVDRHVDGLWVTISISGELDYATAPELRAALVPEALPAGRRNVALDLSGLTFCDSSGLGVILGGHRRLGDDGGRLMLRHVPECLARRMRATGLDRMIHILETGAG